MEWVGMVLDGSPVPGRLPLEPADEERCQDFLSRFPAYGATRALDDLRQREYRRLDEQGHVYLDYTGSSLYAQSQIEDHLRLMRSGVFGNPHSPHPAAIAATDLIEETREQILRYFRASPEEYHVIFTQNATGAIKLIGESYPLCEGATLLLSSDNHNSVNGLREFAAAKGAFVRYAPLEDEEERLDPQALRAELAQGPGKAGLFAFPAQSNFTGVHHDLSWIDEAHALGWDVLLDAAAFAPTNTLDLSACHPDFVPVSFYKIFGYPTGVGCLIARKDALRRLQRPWYSGGTVAFASVRAFHGAGSAHYLQPGPSGFEDGTLNFLGIPAVGIGLRHVEKVGLDLIHTRVTSLTGWLLEELSDLRYEDGKVFVQIYGPRTTKGRGGTVLFNVLRPDGRMVDADAVQEAAARHTISVRSGCHCNPGAREVAFHMAAPDLESCFAERSPDLPTFLHSVADRLDGAVRASFGIASNFRDALGLVRFLALLRDEHAAAV